MKKTLSVILSLVMILGIVASVPFTAQAVEADGITSLGAYAFCTDSEAEDFARLAVGTDYTKSQGLVKRDYSVYGSTTYWWMSSSGSSPNLSGVVNDKGQCKGGTFFFAANIGVLKSRAEIATVVMRMDNAGMFDK